MTDRITKPIKAMKEYGRKPYLVTKDAIPYGEKADYRYMMDTTWHKAQDNEQIIVQSVKKKPYQNSDYQAMEQGYDFPIFTFPRWNFQFDFPQTIYRIKPEPYPTEPTEPTEQYLKIYPPEWVSCPTLVSPGKTYNVVVKNARAGTNGVEFYLDTIFKVYKDIWTIGTIDVYWYKKDKITRGVLRVSSGADGDFTLKATSGGKTIEKDIVASDAIDCGGNPTVIAQGATVDLSVTGGVLPINWTMAHVGNSFGFTLTPDIADNRKAQLSVTSSGRGSVTIKVTDANDDYCYIGTYVEGDPAGEGITFKCSAGSWKQNKGYYGGTSWVCDCLNDLIDSTKATVEAAGYSYEWSLYDSGSEHTSASAAYRAMFPPGDADCPTYEAPFCLTSGNDVVCTGYGQRATYIISKDGVCAGCRDSGVVTHLYLVSSLVSCPISKSYEAW